MILTCHYIDHTHTHTNTDQPVSTKQESVYLAPVSQCPCNVYKPGGGVVQDYTHIYLCLLFLQVTQIINNQIMVV